MKYNFYKVTEEILKIFPQIYVKKYEQKIYEYLF